MRSHENNVRQVVEDENEANWDNPSEMSQEEEDMQMEIDTQISPQKIMKAGRNETESEDNGNMKTEDIKHLKSETNNKKN